MEGVYHQRIFTIRYVKGSPLGTKKMMPDKNMDLNQGTKNIVLNTQVNMYMYLLKVIDCLNKNNNHLMWDS